MINSILKWCRQYDKGRKTSESDIEIPQSETTDQPDAPLSCVFVLQNFLVAPLFGL